MTRRYARRAGHPGKVAACLVTLAALRGTAASLRGACSERVSWSAMAPNSCAMIGKRPATAASKRMTFGDSGDNVRLDVVAMHMHRHFLVGVPAQQYRLAEFDPDGRRTAYDADDRECGCRTRGPSMRREAVRRRAGRLPSVSRTAGCAPANHQTASRNPCCAAPETSRMADRVMPCPAALYRHWRLADSPRGREITSAAYIPACAPGRSLWTT